MSFSFDTITPYLVICLCGVLLYNGILEKGKMFNEPGIRDRQKYNKFLKAYLLIVGSVGMIGGGIDLLINNPYIDLVLYGFLLIYSGVFIFVRKKHRG